MGQKKKDTATTNYSDKPLAEVQADHELFLQAFEKPTQIYRYLRTRNILSPVFLHRSLYYMKNRMSRSHRNRSSFSLDALLEKVEKFEQKSSHPGSFLNLSFIGFFDKKVEGDGELAKLEVHIIKICHKKRKEASAPMTQECVDTCDVRINPQSVQSNAESSSTNSSQACKGLQLYNHNNSSGRSSVGEPLVSIPTQTFGGSNGHQVKSYLLQFKIDLVHDQENVCEPAAKRRRLSKGGSSVAAGSENSCATSRGSTESVTSSYRAELVVYDRHGRCQLTPGSYELVLHPAAPGGAPSTPSSPSSNGCAPRATMSASPRKNASWETAEDLKVETTNLSNFQNSRPTLQFFLTWSEEAGGPPSNSTASVPPAGTNGVTAKDEYLKPLVKPKQPLSVILANKSAAKPKHEGVSSPEAPQLVLYQFVYNNNGRQQTEARRDFHCPWCSINCLALYCLLKHLKLCHARFTFTYVPHPKGARIDVALNDCYDGSYAGNPQDLVWLTGGAGGGGALFSRTGPVRRAPVTALLVCRPRRSKPSLSEFLVQDHVDFDLPRSYILGHNRLYHHTMSCRPIGAHELDEDSEGEHDSEWMRSKTTAMIDDFSDVNEGEKEIMKLWNIHVMRHNFVGDCQLPMACSMFVENHGREVIERNLYRNYLLHLVSLYDFGVMGAGAVYNNIRQLQALMKESDSTVSQLSGFWSKHRTGASSKAFYSPRTSHSTLLNASLNTSLAAKSLFTSTPTAASAAGSSTSNTTTPVSKTLSKAQTNGSYSSKSNNIATLNSNLGSFNSVHNSKSSSSNNHSSQSSTTGTLASHRPANRNNNNNNNSTSTNSHVSKQSTNSSYNNHHSVNSSTQSSKNSHSFNSLRPSTNSNKTAHSNPKSSASSHSVSVISKPSHNVNTSNGPTGKITSIGLRGSANNASSKATVNGNVKGSLTSKSSNSSNSSASSAFSSSSSSASSSTSTAASSSLKALGLINGEAGTKSQQQQSLKTKHLPSRSSSTRLSL